MENDRKHNDLCVRFMGIRPMINKELASKHRMHRKTAVCIEGCDHAENMQRNDPDTPTKVPIIFSQICDQYGSRLMSFCI